MTAFTEQDLQALVTGDELRVDVSAYLPGGGEQWCTYLYTAPGNMAVYPYKVQVPGRGVGQFKASEVRAWRLPRPSDRRRHPMKPHEKIQQLRAQGYAVKVSHLRFAPMRGPELELAGADGVPHTLVATERQIRALGLELLTKGGLTLVSIFYADGSPAAKGKAICRPDETFNRRLGLMIALGRAAKELHGRHARAAMDTFVPHE